MEIEHFLNYKKQAKKDTKMTAFYKVKVAGNSDRTIQTLFREEICKTCKNKNKQSIMVFFKESQRLTIFQAEMLFAVFALNRIPIDYANYHKCEAGKKFIQNIDKIVVAGEVFD